MHAHSRPAAVVVHRRNNSCRRYVLQIGLGCLIIGRGNGGSSRMRHMSCHVEQRHRTAERTSSGPPPPPRSGSARASTVDSHGARRRVQRTIDHTSHAPPHGYQFITVTDTRDATHPSTRHSARERHRLPRNCMCSHDAQAHFQQAAAEENRRSKSTPCWRRTSLVAMRACWIPERHRRPRVASGSAASCGSGTARAGGGASRTTRAACRGGKSPRTPRRGGARRRPSRG